jgi:hypothetical protein
MRIITRQALVATLASAIAAPLYAQESRDVALQSLVAAERGFAARTKANGIRDGFLANLADSSIILRPAPTLARPLYEGASPTSPALLLWEPIFADVSADGLLGYTTGPSEFRPRGAADTTVIYGHFVSMWRRAPGGPWKVELDVGVNHEKLPAPLALRTASDPGGVAARDAIVERASLLRSDSTLGRAGRTEGTALAAGFDATVRLHRLGLIPITGRDTALRVLASDGRAYTSEPSGSGIAKTGDLGYTYGRYSHAAIATQPADSGYYLRLWRRRDDGWRIVLDLATAPAR